jgi:hypothetical protein
MDKRWISNVATNFAAMFGIGSAIVSGFDIKQWSFMGESVLFALIGTAVQILYLYLTKKRFQKFFGLLDNVPVNIAIASYWNVNVYDERLGEEKNYRYYKHDGDLNKKRYLVGAVEYPLTDVGVAAEAIQLAAYINRTGEHKVNLFGDENIHDAIEGTIICLGSPTSNSATKRLFARLPSEFNLSFTTKTLTSWLHEHEYRSNEKFDYGVLMRCTLNEKIYFVCAGIDEHGSIALSKLLMMNWKELPKVDFVQLYKVSKERSQVIDKLAGKTLFRPGEWVSD